MINNKYIEEEISKLKNKDKPKVKDNAIPPNLIDNPISQKNLKDEKIIKLASGAELDEAIDAKQFMHKIYEREIEAGNIPSSTSYDEWIINLRTSLSGGGKVLKFSNYKKPKIKTIDIGAYLDLGRTLSSLSQSERDTLKWILNRSLYKKD